MGVTNGELESALKPLRAASGAVETLRGEEADPQLRRGALLKVTAALEGTLRRLLRDDPRVPIDLRLQALAPDELPTSEVVAELRRRDRISIELAAAFHDLAVRSRRIRDGADPDEADTELALRVVERVEWEAAAPPPAPVPTPEEPVFVDDDSLVHPVPPASRIGGNGRAWGAVALLLLVVGVLAFALRGRNDDSALREGVAHFRNGRPAEAVAKFQQYAEENPDDPTPRLYLARIHRRAGRLDQALVELRKGLQAAPQDAGLHRELGFLLLDSGRPDAAVGRFREAIRIDPEPVEGYIGLVRALRAAGRPDAAERVLAAAPPEVRALMSGAGPPSRAAVP